MAAFATSTPVAGRASRVDASIGWTPVARRCNRPAYARRPRCPAVLCPPRCAQDLPLDPGRSPTIGADNLGEFERYLRDVAKVASPAHLDGLLHILVNLRGEEMCKPGDRNELHPFLVPLTRNRDTGAITGLLRWPTPPEGMEMPVVRSPANDLSVELLAVSSLQYVTRALAAADFAGRDDDAGSIRRATALALGYKNGDVEKAGYGLERFLILNVGPFPDVYEGLAQFHIAKGDTDSGLVTCERASSAFPGWGRPHVFHSQVLTDLGRESEARDAARFGLQMPLWTLGAGDAVQRMGRLAGYEDDASLGKIYRRLYEDKREKEVEEGKAPEQVALDRAAYLLDVTVAEGASSWSDDVREDLAELYQSAGLEDVATFIRY